MLDIKVKADELIADFNKVEKILKIDAKKVKLKELEAKTTDPDFWTDQANARVVMQSVGDLKHEIDEFDNLSNDLKVLGELSKSGQLDEGFSSDIDKVTLRLNKLKLASFLNGAYDNHAAIVSIHAGQGGVEAMDWASMLHRMYTRYFEKKGWNYENLEYSLGEEAGIKSVTARVNGAYVYGYLKGEAGTHRLVRQSPFNADNLRQTSFALVEVLPEIEEIDEPDIVIKDEDLDWQFFRASSQGGQNVQKVSTAVRLKHIPTGIVVTAQTERFQVQNRKYALAHLRARLWALNLEQQAAEKKTIKGDYKPASWGNQIRSYVLHPYKMVKDLRTNFETGNAESVLDGNIDGFIEAELKSDKE